MSHKKHMMSIFKLGLAGFGICLLLLAYSFILSIKNNYKDDEQVDVKYRLYNNDQYGFQMEIPDTWVESVNLPQGTDFALVDKNIQDGVPVFISGKYIIKDINKIGFNNIVDDSKKLYEKSIYEDNGGTPTKFLSDKNIKLNGLDARLISSKSKKYDYEHKNIDDYIDYELFVNKGDGQGVYVLLGGYKAELKNEYDKMILNSLLSFKVADRDNLYTYNKYNFQLNLSKDFVEVKDHPVANGFALLDDNRKIRIVGVITPHAMLKGLSFTEAVNNYKDSNKDLKSISDKNIKVDDLNARLIQINTTDKNSTLSGYRLFIDDVKNDKIYLILGVCESKHFEEYKGEILNSLLSFKILR